MSWLKFMTAEALYAQLDLETSNASCTGTLSDCDDPAPGAAPIAVAWAAPGILPRPPATKTLSALPTANQALLKAFRRWLSVSGCGPAGRLVYGHAVHLAFSLIDKDWRDIDVVDDLAGACRAIVEHCPDPVAARHLSAGLDYFTSYLSTRQQRRRLPRSPLRGNAMALADWPAAAESAVAASATAASATAASATAASATARTLMAILDEAESNAHPTDRSGCVPMQVPSTDAVPGDAASADVADGSHGRRRFVKSSILPPDASRGASHPILLVPVRQWTQPNQAFYQHFRNWLHWSGYSPSALYLYGLSVRLTFSLFSKDWREFDPATDLNTVRDWVGTHQLNDSTRQAYLKGLNKFEQYLRLRQSRQLPPKGDPGHARSPTTPTTPTTPTSPITAASLARTRATRHPPFTPLPESLSQSIAEYRDHCARNWPRACVADLGRDLLRRVTHPLRWLVAQGYSLPSPESLTPRLWMHYVDARLADGITHTTLNGTRAALVGWLRWRAEQQQPIDARMLLVKPFKAPPPLPKDVPLSSLRQLQSAIVAEANSPHPPSRRRGIMDAAWFLLMLHSGLRTGEVRRLTFGDIDWERRLIRIEQSKGLKDRLAPFSREAGQALNHYLALRERETALTDVETDVETDETESATRVVFLDRHRPLSTSYCYERLQTYGQRVGVRCSPHQLRHSCATLLLNSGMPLASVQALLGHRWIETTLGYARLYDGSLAADYARAMLSVEHQWPRLQMVAGDQAPLALAQLIALADGLRAGGALNAQQLDALAAIRAGLVSLAAR